jgi:hypothetical protein
MDHKRIPWTAVFLSAAFVLAALPAWAAVPRVVLAEDFSATW